MIGTNIAKVHPASISPPFSSSNNQSNSINSSIFFSFSIRKLSHDNRVYSVKKHGHLFFFVFFAFCFRLNKRIRGLCRPPACWMMRVGGERTPHAPSLSSPGPFLKSTNHGIVVAQSALLSCRRMRRGHGDEWHTEWSHYLANHVGTFHWDSIITRGQEGTGRGRVEKVFLEVLLVWVADRAKYSSF